MSGMSISFHPPLGAIMTARFTERGQASWVTIEEEKGEYDRVSIFLTKTQAEKLANSLLDSLRS
jgi:hypothetical protein